MNHRFYHFSLHWNGDLRIVVQYYQTSFLLLLQVVVRQLLGLQSHLLIEREMSLQMMRMEPGKNKEGLFPTIHYILNKLLRLFLQYRRAHLAEFELGSFVDEASYHPWSEIHFEWHYLVHRFLR